MAYTFFKPEYLSGPVVLAAAFPVQKCFQVRSANLDEPRLGIQLQSGLPSVSL